MNFFINKNTINKCLYMIQYKKVYNIKDILKLDFKLLPRDPNYQNINNLNYKKINVIYKNFQKMTHK